MRHLQRFVRFAVVGAFGTAAHYALLLALVEILGADPVVGSVAGFLLGALVNYTLNRRWVFRSDREHLEALPRFLAVAGMGLVGNSTLMALLVGMGELHYLLAQILTTSLLLVWHYVANALWTFRKRPSAVASPDRFPPSE